jgi:hypothetical protein
VKLINKKNCILQTGEIDKIKRTASFQLVKLINKKNCSLQLVDVVLFIYQFHQFEGCGSFYLSISPV